MKVHKHSCLNCEYNIEADISLKKVWVAHPSDAELFKLKHYYCERREPHAKGQIIVRENCLINKNDCKNFYEKT